MKTGKLIIFSAPSGCGKSTIIGWLMRHSELRLAFSISCTSRQPRGTEQNGVEYFFITPEEFRRRNSLDQRPIVALLAGSRRNEIRDNLPLMAALSQKFPERQFVVAGVAWIDRALYEQHMAGSDIRYVCDQTYETLAGAEAAGVKSGTATLETALLGIPEAVGHRTVWWRALIHM